MKDNKKKYELKNIIPQLTDEQLNVASGMIDDALFMEEQLQILRENIRQSGGSEAYQYGTKQTADMQNYLKMQKQYGVTIRYLSDLVLKNPAKENDELMDFLNDD